MSEHIGRCPKCGEYYYGWALRDPHERYCEVCGSSLEIYNCMENSRRFNPFILYPLYRVTFDKMKKTIMAN
jgi:uncharacterized protein (DUF983 family)